jgi:hypothetical protein
MKKTVVAMWPAEGGPGPAQDKSKESPLLATLNV